MEHENNYSSKAVGGTALGIGIGALGLELLGGGALGNLFGGRSGGGDHPVSRYESELAATIARLETDKKLLESTVYTDGKTLELYRYIDGKLAGVEAQIGAQAVWNATANANLACLQNQVNTLAGLTKTVIPATSICPEVMPKFNSWTAPTATT
jgi:hypothetical protein